MDAPNKLLPSLSRPESGAYTRRKILKTHSTHLACSKLAGLKRVSTWSRESSALESRELKQPLRNECMYVNVGMTRNVDDGVK